MSFYSKIKRIKKEFACLIPNLIPIIRFNFHYLPFKQAIYLPVFIKNARLKVLKGQVSIEAKRIYPGMIRLGFPSSCMVTNKGFYWLNRGKVLFNGTFKVANDSVIETCSDAELIIGNNVSINGGLRMTCAKKIVIGDDFLGSWNISIYDTDFHRMTCLKTHKIIDSCSSEIIIGNHCWIGFGATLLKGSKLGGVLYLRCKILIE